MTGGWIACIHGRTAAMTGGQPAQPACADCAELDLLRQLEASVRRFFDCPVDDAPMMASALPPLLDRLEALRSSRTDTLPCAVPAAAPATEPCEPMEIDNG